MKLLGAGNKEREVALHAEGPLVCETPWQRMFWEREVYWLKRRVAQHLQG